MITPDNVYEPALAPRQVTFPVNPTWLALG